MARKFIFFTPPSRRVRRKVSMGGWAEGQACTDSGVRTPIGASGNLTFSFPYLSKVFIRPRKLNWNILAFEQWKLMAFSFCQLLLNIRIKYEIKRLSVFPPLNVQSVGKSQEVFWSEQICTAVLGEDYLGEFYLGEGENIWNEINIWKIQFFQIFSKLKTLLNYLTSII